MYIRCIDGLRAFAILLVISSHAIHTGVPPWLKITFAHWNAGTVGVRLFFLISGFLITNILNDELRKSGRINFRKFFMRRILRIFPAFYFYLIILGVLSYLGFITIEPFAIIFAFFYIQNFNVFQNTDLFPSSWLVNHAWSLSVEEQFYIVFPFLLKKLKIIIQNHLFKMAIMMILICSFFRMLNYSLPEISRMTFGVFFMHCDFLFYGAVLALCIENSRDYLKKKLFPFRHWLLLMASVILIYSSRIEYYSALNILISGNLILFSNFYILLFILLFPNSTLGKALEYKPVKALGKLSYSLYIWQQLFLGSTGLWIKYTFLTMYPYNIVLVFICATCSYLLIERPFLHLKKFYA